MEQEQDSIRCMLLSITDCSLLLPSFAVAEIAPVVQLHPITSSPDWFLGMMDWRGTDLPIVNLENMSTKDKVAIPHMEHIAVLNTIKENIQFPFMAFVLQDLPKFVVLTEEELTSLGEPETEIFLDKVSYLEQDFFIPNMQFVQETIEQFLIEKGVLFSI